MAKHWRLVFFCASLALFALATPCVFFGGLGLLGILADVGPGENRSLGLQCLRISLVPAAGGAVCLAIAAWLHRRVECGRQDSNL